MTHSTSWQLLGAVAPRDLVDARIQAHWAAQLAAGTADCFAERAEDDSHSNLGWIETLRALVGRPLGKEGSVHVGLRIQDLTVLVLDADLATLATLALGGRGLAAARGELSRLVDSRTGAAGTEIVFRGYNGMPEHDVAGSGHFDPSDSAAFAELGRWYSNAACELAKIANSAPGAADVRCWPHHFDLATLITLDGDARDGQTRTIGVGMTPGDGSYAEPYWYVTPYPYPADPKLGSLAGGGQWHREGWLGAVLTGSAALDCAAQPEAQRDLLRGFLQSAIESVRALLAK